MFSKFLTVLTKIPSVSKVFLRNQTYYCFNPCAPVVPACYWSVLPNGLKIITEQTCTALACVSMFVETGPMHEIPCNNGITYFIERMAFKGNTALNKYCLEERVRTIGATLDCKTTREYQIFSATCPPEYTSDILEILSQILTSLDYSYIDCEKMEIMKEINDLENDPKQLCFDYLHKTAFQGTPLGLPIVGPPENYKRFDANYTQTYIKEMYLPSRIIVSFSGALTHEQVVCVATKWFGKMKDPKCVIESSPSRFTGSQVMFRHDGMPFSHNAIAVEAPGYNSSLYLTFRLFVEIMGSWDKCQGASYRTWPETAQYAALGDSCESYETFYIPYREVGLFGVYFVAANGKDLDDVVYNIQTHFMQLCSTLQYADMQRAQNRLKLKMGKEVSGCQRSCLDMAVQMNYFGMRKNLCSLWEAVSHLKSPECKNIADQYIFDRCVACSSVGPTESLPDYNRIRSGMYWLRL